MNSRHLPLLASLFTWLQLTPRSEAETIYSNLQDITIPTNFSGVYLDIDTGATSSSAFTGWDINPFYGGVGIGNSAAFQPVRVGTSNLDAILNLAPGTVISNTLTFATGFGGSGNPGNEHLGPGTTQFQPGSDGYLGFKFTTDGGAGPYYGWMRVTLTNDGSGALVKDWGYDNAGGTIAVGRVNQSAAVNGTQTVTLSPGTGESFTLGSAITNTASNTNSLLKTGSGTTALGVANTFTGTTRVSDGTLGVSVAGALGNTASVTVNSGGTLLLGGTGDRINNSAALILAGGSFNTAGTSETLGALTLSSSSVIDFGTNGGASSLVFAPSGNTWSGTLSIFDWSGSTSSPDHLFFGSNSSGLNNSQLSQINFFSGQGTGFLGTGEILGSGEIVPVPEASTFIVVTVLAGIALWREGRRPGRGKT